MAMNRKRVLVPVVMDKAGIDLLRARDDIDLTLYELGRPQEQFRAMHGDVAGIALSLTPFGAAEMAAAPHLAVVARIGVGYDAVDVPALTAQRVPLMIAGTSNSTSVAEHALFFILAVAKRAGEMDRRVKTGNWPDRRRDLPVELSGKTALVVGFGRIGSRSAPRLAAFGMQVLVHDPYVPAERIRAAGFEPVADLDAALPRVDFVTIHCPKNAETNGMFGAARFARMKRGSFIVNTARGGIINEPALLAALESGQIAAAGLDVFEKEPADADNPLLKHEAVFTAPHMAGVTVESMAAMAETTARNILGVLDGTPNVENAVNPEVFERRPG
ncbi:MAG: hydroxyacid dehydrogenase [Alphaproteobacteria bacterium]|nr:hydroxyacid dehydrogenase [Alphaproteobacteria bacterium]